MRRNHAVALLTAVGALAVAPSALANHPVIVEGNCNNANDPAFSPVPAPGTCGDYDGDSSIGTAEDNDGDRVFGTINGANRTGSAAARINNNGNITIVASGLFAERVVVNSAPTGNAGNVTIQAAPGVEAVVDAVRQGDPASTARQNQPGFIIDTPPDRQVTLRNLTTRNWTSGIQVRNRSRVAIEDVRAENNTDYGIEVLGASSRVSVSDSNVRSTGRRQSPAGDFPSVDQPDPGTGIEFAGGSAGTVFDTVVTGSVATGIAGNGNVCIAQVNVFDNDGGDISGVGAPGTNCIGTQAQ